MISTKRRLKKLTRRISDLTGSVLTEASASVHTSKDASTHSSSSHGNSFKNNKVLSPHEHAIAAAQEKKAEFCETLPPSLLDEIGENSNQDAIVLAPFQRDEITLGPLLGSGEFSHVFEIKSFDLALQGDNEKYTSEEMESRLRMKKCERYRQTENCRYALKHIKKEYFDKGEDRYVDAACDIALEAEFLAALNHPHIIKLRGMTHSKAAGFANGPQGFFLIIDRLEETLDQMIRSWREPVRRPVLNRRASTDGRHGGLRSSLARGMSFKRFSLDEEDMEDETPIRVLTDEQKDERLSIALQISAALVYLHSHSVIFRDLKPANIGFDVRGDVKLFDFGLARIVPKGKPYNDTFEMSGAGSPRYMPPECLCMDEYNLKADTYTFALVLWEMLSTQTPYAFTKKRSQLIEYVVKENRRPTIPNDWPRGIQSVLKSSFDALPENRPRMFFVHDTIKKTLSTLRGGDNRGLTHSFINRRRSCESMLYNSILSIVDNDEGDMLSESLRACG